MQTALYEKETDELCSTRQQYSTHEQPPQRAKSSEQHRVWSGAHTFVSRPDPVSACSPALTLGVPNRRHPAKGAGLLENCAAMSTRICCSVDPQSQ